MVSKKLFNVLFVKRYLEPRFVSKAVFFNNAVLDLLLYKYTTMILAFTYTHTIKYYTDRQTNRQTDKQTYRQTQHISVSLSLLDIKVL